MALTASRELNRYVDQELRTFPVGASEKVWKGAMVGVDRSTGHVRNLVGGDMFAGIAYEEIDNSAGSGGDLMIRLYTQGDFVLTANNASQNWVGSPVYATSDDVTTVLAIPSSSYCGVLLSVVGTNMGIIRIQPLAMGLIEHAAQAPLASSTSSATQNPVLIAQRPIKIKSVEVSFNTVPDQGVLNVGTDASDPDEVVNNFNLATLAANTPTTMSLVNRDIAAGVRLWAKVGQASSTAGDCGILTVRYSELP